MSELPQIRSAPCARQIVAFCNQCGAYASDRRQLPAICAPWAKRVYRDSIRTKTLESGTTITIADNVEPYNEPGADRGPRT